MLRTRTREAARKQHRQNAGEGFRGDLDIRISVLIRIFERCDFIELIVREFNQASGQSKEPIDLRWLGAGALLIANIVLKFGPGMLQDRADLHLKAHADVVS